MIPSQNVDFGIYRSGASELSYCPECGQPLTFAHAEPGHRNAVSWRSIFVIAVGLYLAITFGVGAWHAEEANRPANACPGAGEASDCASIGMDLAQKLATQELSGGAALAARITDRDFGSDLRFTVVGLAGVAIGLAATFVRLKRPRRLAFSVDLVLAAEGLLTVFYGQVLLFAVSLLVTDSPTGTPLTLDNLSDSLFRALTRIFALVGVR
jgi:hypothetical protein